MITAYWIGALMRTLWHKDLQKQKYSQHSKINHLEHIQFHVRINQSKEYQHAQQIKPPPKPKFVIKMKSYHPITLSNFLLGPLRLYPTTLTDKLQVR